MNISMYYNISYKTHEANYSTYKINFIFNYYIFPHFLFLPSRRTFYQYCIFQQYLSSFPPSIFKPYNISNNKSYYRTYARNNHLHSLSFISAPQFGQKFISASPQSISRYAPHSEHLYPF